MLPVDCCFTRYNLHTLTLFFSCFPTLASHFYRNSHEDCKVSRSQTMWATYLASTNNISLHCSLSCHFQVLTFDFRFILWLLNNIVWNFRCLLQSFLCDYFLCIYWCCKICFPRHTVGPEPMIVSRIGYI